MLRADLSLGTTVISRAISETGRKPLIRKWELGCGDCSRRGGLFPPPTAQLFVNGGRRPPAEVSQRSLSLLRLMLFPEQRVFSMKPSTSRRAVSGDRVSPSVKNMSLHPLPHVYIHDSAACCCFLLLQELEVDGFYDFIDSWLELMAVNGHSSKGVLVQSSWLLENLAVFKKRVL